MNSKTEQPNTAEDQETIELGTKDLVIQFSLKKIDQGVTLSQVIHRVEEKNGIVVNIHSRQIKSGDKLEFLTEIAGIAKEDEAQFMEAIQPLVDDLSQHKITVPWFPRKIREIDVFAHRVKKANEELKSDHPGFQDKEYRARRQEFEDIALSYKHGQLIPYMEYTPEEIKTWNTIFQCLTKLFPTHACREFNDIWPFLVRECDYKLGSIPQLQVVSDFIKERSGFTLRPVAGLLSPRDFLAGLAFRVFHSTQYIRHGSKPLYTPEPDVVHELVGHVPLLADPEFAEFSQEIGLASLGAPDDWIDKLSTLYWFTVEFGLCKEGSEVKAYGAGLLSSFGELEYCLTDKPVKEIFFSEVTANTEYPITNFFFKYFVAESFKSAREKLKSFAAQIPRPFSVRYNAFTQSIDVIENKDDLSRFGKELQTDLGSFMNALNRML
ncbi:protein henna [Exaiptasia diaphana]|uniref:phenylalanine 4-monooxygenase n=1 Tax=Exaiptasia diaphana TaxID=2652724 RepID=A0A913X3U7_EXADI|nr:protein henna [Exaiptasia diaphana]